MLAAITVSGISVIHLTGIFPPFRQAPERVASIIADKIEQHRDDPIQLQTDLDELSFLVRASLAVYDSNGNTLAKAGSFPATVLSPDNLKKLACGNFFVKGILTIPLPGQRNSETFLLLSQSKNTWHFRLAVILVVVTLFLTLLAYPLTRFILRPLNIMSRTSQALGAGDLSARTGLRRNDELGLLARTIDNMAERLQKLLHSEKEMLANISHEFRSPLARMRVALELSKEKGVSSEEIRSYLLGIEDDISELDQLVSDVLLTVKLEIGNGEGIQMTLKKQPLYFAELIELSAQRFHHKHPDMELLIELEPDLPVVQVDPVLIRRVLDNLLDNSAKYGKSLPVSIRATATTELFVEVRDKGAGADEKDLKQLFVPFFRSDPARSVKGGVGLGLTLCKRIIEAHHGSISARTPADGGLAISFTLPL